MQVIFGQIEEIVNLQTFETRTVAVNFNNVNGFYEVKEEIGGVLKTYCKLAFTNNAVINIGCDYEELFDILVDIVNLHSSEE